MTGRTDPLARRVRAFCGKWDMLPRGGLALCAVSGGRDSMTLLHLLRALAEEGDFRVAAAHFNHGLRPAADRDEEFVRHWCREWGVPLTCGRGDAGAFARREGLGLEDGARRLRYAFLETAARDMGADRVATAHHREDNAETVLLHLLRGSGLRGLGGIPPVRGNIARPLLETGREDIDGYVRRNGVPYVEDESNRDVRFTRNRLRLEVLPLLEEMFPGCGERLAGTGALLREEDDHLQRETELLLGPAAGDEVSVPVETLARQDAALRRRLVRTMARQLGAELARAQTEAVLALGAGGAADLPGNLRAVREPGRLVLRRREALPPPMALHEGAQDWGPWRVTLGRSGGTEEEGPGRVLLRDAGGELSIAPWDGTGRLAVENGRRTLKRLFADAGVPADRREGVPVLLLDGEPVAAFGVATDRDLRPRAGEDCWSVSISKQKA